MSELNPETNPAEELRASNSNQHGDDGLRDTSEKVRDADPDADADAGTIPETSTGRPEPKPEGLPPKAAYPSKDPRSEEHPYRAD